MYLQSVHNEEHRKTCTTRFLTQDKNRSKSNLSSGRHNFRNTIIPGSVFPPCLILHGYFIVNINIRNTHRWFCWFFRRPFFIKQTSGINIAQQHGSTLNKYNDNVENMKKLSNHDLTFCCEALFFEQGSKVATSIWGRWGCRKSLNPNSLGPLCLPEQGLQTKLPCHM